MRTTPVREWSARQIASRMAWAFLGVIVGGFFLGQAFSAMVTATGGLAVVFCLFGIAGVLFTLVCFIACIILPVAWMVS